MMHAAPFPATRRAVLSRIFRVGALVSTGILTGCRASEDDGSAVEYACGTEHFTVEYRGDTALVSWLGDTLRLPLAVSASGARYSDGTHTYWEHQGTARFELPDTTYAECRPGAA